MRIAMIGHKRIPSREGGIEIVVAELSSRLVSRGNDVVAYNRRGHHVSGREFETADNITTLNGITIKTVFTFENSKLNAAVYCALAAIRASFSKFDVIHFHAEGPSAMVWLPHLFGKRTIVTIHGLDWKRSKWGGFAAKYLKFGEKMAAKYADEIIVLSENVRQYFLVTYGRKTNYIPNGITKPQMRNDSHIKEKFNICSNGYILYLGRIVPEKGIHYLIDAYNEIETDKKLVIAGGSSHTDEYMKTLKQSAKGNKNIIFTDFVQGIELEELYSNAYIYCLPSDLEGMPLSLLEAMSYGNCCLTSDIPECREVCEDHAEYFEQKNKNSLREKLLLLLHNSNLVNKYKNTSSDFICAKFNWDDITDRTLALYKGE